MYTIIDFRKNLREAFNQADQGRIVEIERFKKRYQLVLLEASENIKINPNNTISPKDPAKPSKLISRPTVTLKDNKVEFTDTNYDFCPHNQVKGFCKKGCR